MEIAIFQETMTFFLGTLDTNTSLIDMKLPFLSFAKVLLFRVFTRTLQVLDES